MNAEPETKDQDEELVGEPVLDEAIDQGETGHDVQLPTFASPPATPAPDEAMVQARDRAIEARLRQGAAGYYRLLAAMPTEDGQTVDQRKAALDKVLRRLELRGRIRSVSGEWRLA